MQDPLAHLAPEALHQHHRWLRGLLRDLIRDPHLVEDVAQDVWAAACAHKIADLKPWMRRVARAFATRRSSRESTRRTREAKLTRPLQEVSALDAITRVETEQRVVEAMLALSEPYRTTVVLRYFEDLPPRRIAGRMAVPVETVRTRLRRAIEQMRSRLDEGSGGRAAWVVPAAGGSPWLYARVLLSSLPVAMKTKAILVPVCVMLAVGTAWLCLSDGSPSFSDPDANRGTLQVGSAERALARRASTQDPDTTERVESRSTEQRNELQSTQPHVELTGRCVVVGVDRIPVPIAGVRASLRLGRRIRLSPRDRMSTAVSPDPVATAADGRFSIRCQVSGDTGRLRLEGGGIVPLASGYSVLKAGVIDYGDIPVTIGCEVRGRLRDVDGHALAGCGVRIGKHLVPFERTAAGFAADPGLPPQVRDLKPTTGFAATTAADGTFVVDHPVAPGEWMVGLWSRRRIVSSGEFSVEPGCRTRSLDLTAEASTSMLSGRIVFDRTDLLRMPRLSVRLSTGQSWSFTVDEHGEFEIPGFARDPDGPVTLTAHARYHLSAKEKFPWGTRDAQLELQPLAALRVHVIDASTGAAVLEYGLRVFRRPAPDKNLTASDCILRHLGKHEGGRSRYPGLRAGPHFVTVEPVREDLAPTWFVPVDLLGDGGDAVTIRLDRLAHRSFVIVDADAKPVADCRVELLLPLGDAPVTPATRRVTQRYMSGWRLDRALLIEERASGSDGRVEFRTSPRTDYAIRVAGDGLEPRVLRTVAIRPGLESLSIEVRRGATVRGSIRGLPDLRADWPKLELVYRESLALSSRSRDSDRLVLGAAGEFEFPGLPPGSFELLAHIPRRYPPISVAVIDNLESGETRTLELDGAVLRPGRLSGRITVDGDARRGKLWLIRVKREVGVLRSHGPVQTDEQGGFEIEGPPGEYRVSFRLPSAERKRPVVFLSVAIVRLRAGELATGRFDFRSRRFAVRILDRAGQPAAHRAVVILWRGHDHYPGSPRATDADGRVRMDHAPEGEFTIGVWPRHLTDPEAQGEYRNKHRDSWREVLIVLPAVRAGGTRPGSLRMPR